MFLFFSPLHVQLLSRSVLNPGEQLTGQTVTTYVPWWAFGLIQRQHLVLATNQRLVLVEHRLGFFPPAQRLHAVDSLAWRDVEEARVKGIFKKKLRIRGTGERGPVRLSLAISNALFGLLAFMKNNMAGARAIASAFEAARSAPALGPASYGPAPNIAFAPAPAQLAPASQPPSQIPAQNAPGYSSVPPPPPVPNFGAAQPAQPTQPVPMAPPGLPPRPWS